MFERLCTQTYEHFLNFQKPYWPYGALRHSLHDWHNIYRHPSIKSYIHLSFFFINFALCRWQVQLRIPCHGRIKSRRHLRFSISHNGKINIGQLFKNSSQMFIFLDVFNHSRMLERIYIYNLTCPTALWNLRNVLHTGVRESITREQELQEISIYDL